MGRGVPQHRRGGHGERHRAGQYQSAIAHAAYEAVRTHFTDEARAAMHGEIVAVALFWQLRFSGMEELQAPLRNVMRGLHMPLTLCEIGIEDTPANRMILQRDLACTRFVRPEDAERLSRALDL